MGKIKVTGCEIEGLKIIKPEIYGDERGYFLETYNINDYKNAGIDCIFVQDNLSMSKYGTLRGMHYQVNNPQDKLVRVVQGSVYDVVVDIRKGSNTYKKWFGINLSSENRKQLYIPKGFAHGFLVMSDIAIFEYKCSDYYNSNDEGGIPWDDEVINIDWPIQENMSLLISEKDRNYKKKGDI